MNPIARRLGKLCLALSLASGSALAADWTQYRGPHGDGVTSEAIRWPDGGPKALWKVPTPNGFSSFSIGGDGAFTQISEDGREKVLALNAASGKELWSVDVGKAKYQGGGDSPQKKNEGGDGPRSTPAYSDGHVYVYTSELVLYCLDAKTGKVDWSIDMVKAHDAKNITWKNATSPVIDGNLLFVATGGTGQTFVALEKSTGRVVWKSGTDKITHASPVVATIAGTKQVIFFMQSGLVSLDVTSGRQLWAYAFPYSTSTAASAVVCDDIVYCSAGYGMGASAAKIAKNGSEFTATAVWDKPINKSLVNHWSTPVYKDGYLYGMFSFKDFGKGPLDCVEVATGTVKWRQPGFGPGNVILAGGKLVALADNGEVVLIDPNPEAYKEIGRVQAVEGKCWSTPAIADGRLYVRSVKEGACLDVAGK